jgi:hypothetical protein
LCSTPALHWTLIPKTSPFLVLTSTHMFKFMITFTLCFKMGEAHSCKTFPKCGASLSYHLILCPFFQECSHHVSLSYSHGRESKSGALRAEVVKVFWTLTPCRKSHLLHHNSKHYSPATASRIHGQSNSSSTRACECCLDSLSQPLCQQGKVVQLILPTNSTHSKRSFSNDH